MQQLEDDMDELFREAASQYPLKGDGQDWNAVMSRLHQPGKSPAPAMSEVKGKWYRRFWLLLLTPLFFIAHLPRLNMGNVLLPGEVRVVATAATVKQGPVSKTAEKQLAKAAVKPQSKGSAAIVTVSGMKAVDVPGRQTTATIRKKHRDNILTTGRSLVPDKAALPDIANHNSSMDRSLGADNNSTVASTGNAVSDQPAIVAQEKKDSVTTALVPEVEKAVTTDSSKPADKAKKQPAVRKGLYAGIIVSPDLSTVKLQQVGKLGYGAGIVVGYRISKRLAIETGLLWDRKYYYSKGEYFETKNLPVGSSWNIKNVNGWCRMFEIPVQAHYYFNIKEKSSWYLNGGVSSYLMNRESYDYQYERNGNVYTSNWAYDNATKNWFSIMHAGVGYERSLGVLGNFRVEPYLKIPVGGIGIGNLPVTSIGLNIGITKSFR